MNTRSITEAFKGRAAATALSVAAAVMLVPANLLPVLSTESSGRERDDTIFSGVVELWRHNLAPIAVIIFGASIVIPILKLVGLACLIYGARPGGRPDARKLTHLYGALDFIGRWSMLDVFLAAFLTGLVQFGEFSTVQARSGIVAFAAAVVLTVMATQAFDPKTLWQGASRAAALQNNENRLNTPRFP